MADIFNLTDTWDDGAVTWYGINIDVTNTASGAASRLIQLEVGGTSKFAVDIAGNITGINNITLGGTVDGRDVAADGTKLDGVEAAADATDATNVAAAGALMDSELTNIAAVKAIDQGVAQADDTTFNSVTSTTDALINGAIIGRSGGDIASNLAFGSAALDSNTTGISHIAIGSDALTANTTAIQCVAIGADALKACNGNNNTAIGFQAYQTATTAVRGFAIGIQALGDVTTGSDNTAIGFQSLSKLTTGNNNIAIGYQSGRYITGGSTSNITASQSIYIGQSTRAKADGEANQIVIGHGMTGNGANTVTMGNGSVTGAHVQVAWTVTSDKRDKAEFGGVHIGLDFVNLLKPSSHRYTEKRGGEAHGPVRYGFLAQDVLAIEKGNPVIVDASNPDKLKLNETALIPVLVNAIQELTARLEKLEGKF